MTRISNEIKIAEKLKFWEEQDTINKELIPRVIKNHEMITDLTFQFEKSLGIIASDKEKLEQISQTYRTEIDDLRQNQEKTLTSIAMIEKELISINESNKMILNEQNLINSKVMEIKKNSELELENLKNTKFPIRNNNVVIYLGISVALILSIIGIVI